MPAGAPVTPDTVFFAASTAKGVAATVVHVLAARGVLGYDRRIAELWPEFGVPVETLNRIQGERDATQPQVRAEPDSANQR
ncbi:MAG TPA: serine hydrolase domain-containing protein [Actinophytocola sp.]|nr:serine hydrolase domain-containing protein [Actinophytocola sp.]